MKIEAMRLEPPIRAWVSHEHSPTQDRDIAVRESMQYVPPEIAHALVQGIEQFVGEDETRQFQFLDLDLPIHTVLEEIGERTHGVRIGFFAKEGEEMPFLTFIPYARNALSQKPEERLIKKGTKRLLHDELQALSPDERDQKIVDMLDATMTSARGMELQ